MLTPYRLIAPFLATALVVLPTTQAQAAAFARVSVEEAPEADSPDAAGDEGAEAPEGEGVEGEGAEGEGAEGEGAEGEGAEVEEPVAEPEPEPEPEPVAEVAPPPALPEGPTRPPEPTIAGKPAKGKGMMIAGGVLLGGGIAGTIASILLTSCPEPANTVGCKYSTHRTLAVPVAASVTLAGGLLLGVGVAYAVRYKKWQNWKPEDDKKIKNTALVPTFMPGGAGLGYVGRF
ncbi:MAG: hypothetical protein R3A79_02770 [Nannocystaceae bacterium]